MERFARGDIRILICTNIVESGLDIQNANTIIIQDVQQFGLAQLYQVFTFSCLNKQQDFGVMLFPIPIGSFFLHCFSDIETRKQIICLYLLIFFGISDRNSLF